MSIIARFKRDIAKHRGRAAVLGVLFVTMVAFGVKAFFELHQPVAVAAVVTPENKPGQAHPVVNSAEAELRMNESKNAKVGQRQIDVAKKFYGAGLLSPAGLNSVLGKW